MAPNGVLGSHNMKSYHAFLVRCWHERTETGQRASAWRFLVMEIGTQPQSPRGFTDWKQLVRYLERELESESPLIELLPSDKAFPTATESDNKEVS